MPEGDTIFRAAAKLEQALSGRKVIRFHSPLPKLADAELEGRTVTQVYARGKNVVIAFDDGRTLQTHLRMQGVWRIRDKAQLSSDELERATRAPHALNPDFSLSIENDAVVAVCLRAAVVELSSQRVLERRLASLGPDLLTPEFDAQQALTNLRTRPDLPIGEALMLQSLLAGIGNVYKSEVLFLERTSPFVKVSELGDERLAAIIERARVLLRRNRGGARRTTFGTLSGMPYYVYERSGQHCLKCDAVIQMRRQGALMRSTYFCAECQGVE